ncbi:spermidine synthase [Haloactinospora alba]|uniref:Spermidine synthase n=1 Tax=Haloactinospora alba TaxID=405555 RepID=A0A543NKS7_9ACTN|nr:fused MFS/spermidine synthase [Haloactinospora alba]TQN32453.1 spermidine synthase [Haloactinospora alba]
MGGHETGDAGPSERPDVRVMRDADRSDAWILVADGTPQSHVDLSDPTYLDFEYVRRLAHVADLTAPEGAPIAALHLGAGALTLPRYIAATRPGSRQRAVDDNPELVERVRSELPWGRELRIRVGIQDARTWLAQRQTASADLLVCDVFAGARTPAALTSVEFHSEVARVLRGTGLAAFNIGDGHRMRHVRSQVATASAVFSEVALLAEPRVLRGRRFGNLVLVASDGSLPVGELAHRAHHDPDMARLLEGAELDRFASGARPVHDADAEASPAPPEDAFLR